MASRGRKRGRSPKKQATAKRGRGRPRKQASAVQTRSQRRANASDIASATISTPVVPEYTPATPFVQPVLYDNGATPVFEPVQPKAHDAKFQFPPPRPDPDDFEAVCMAATRVYLPDRYIMKVYGNTLAYISARELHPRLCYKIVPRDIVHFFVIIHYMGYWRLPSKLDYWNEGDDICGDHPVCRAYGMSYKKFQFLWHNIYLMEPREEVESGESEDEGDTQYDDHRDAH